LTKSKLRIGSPPTARCIWKPIMSGSFHCGYCHVRLTAVGKGAPTGVACKFSMGGRKPLSKGFTDRFSWYCWRKKMRQQYEISSTNPHHTNRLKLIYSI
jgi:hypothetical protein